MRRKVSVVGAGKVGSTVAHILALKHMADVVIVNRTVGTAQGIALDIKQSLHIEDSDVNVIGTSDYGQMAGSDIVVVTAGAQRKEGMTRDDLLRVNSDIIGGVADEIKKNAPQSIVIVVTNPLDAMAQLTKARTGFGRERVIGMAGALDSARFGAFIGEELGVSVNDIRPMVLGSHGDSMVAALSTTTVHGTPVAKLIEKEKLSKIVARTRDGGAEIIKLEGSSAYYAPASAAVSMVDAILNDRKRVIPCSVYLEGEYGISGVFAGVPVMLGKGGAEKVVELALPEEERKALADSAAKIKQSMAQLKL